MHSGMAGVLASPPQRGSKLIVHFTSSADAERNPRNLVMNAESYIYVGGLLVITIREKKVL